MEIKKSETIEDYFNRVTTDSNMLRSNGEQIPEVKIVEKVLRTLNDKFTYIVVSIEQSNDIETITVDELQSTLVMHAHKFNKIKKVDDEQVLKVEERFSTLSVRGMVIWYGHLSYKRIHTLQSKDMVQGLPKLKVEDVTCIDCLNGKQIRNAMPKK
ncbi:hypothetical protein LIER_37960 [Lithospermum erythrorhizon]|uniref:GAG-pre-integrase domain-containing protein n=1 Tax=Lithospermum erythrorhizon TaxID=34254 RepID=A0AAV3PV05_LITER